MNMLLGEISFDAVTVEADDDHIDGCYRLKGEDWKVFYFTHQEGGKVWDGSPVLRSVIWPSGVCGVDGLYPKTTALNKGSVRKFLSEALGCNVDWVEVRGPDALQLK